MVKPLSVEIPSKHLLLCVFLSLLWGSTDSQNSTVRATTIVTNTTTALTTPTTTILTTNVSPPPDAKRFQSVGQNENSINLQWENVGGNSAYVLKYNNSETNVPATGEKLVNYTVTNLKSGTQYTFTLFTVLNNVRSNGVNHTTVTAPTNAENFRSVGQNDTSITLQWNKVNGTFNYTMKVENGTSYEIPLTGNEINNGTKTVPGLQSGTQYKFTLFTLFQNVPSTGVNLLAATVPLNPGMFQSVGQNETSITLQWNRGNRPVKYTLQFNNTNQTDVGIVVNETVSYVVLGLKSGTKYNFTLFATIGNVKSTGVNLMAVTAPSTAKDLKPVDQNETSITLQWTIVNSFLNYELVFNKKSINISASNNIVTHTYTILDLKSATTYNFILYTVFENVRSIGQTCTAFTAPENVKKVNVLGQSESNITLSWEKINNISSYILQINTSRTETINSSQTTVASLSAGTKYNFTLITVFEKTNSTGYTFSAATVPLRVPWVNVTKRSVTSITLTWEQVKNDWSYLLQVNGKDVQTNSSSSTVSSSVPSLEPGKEQKFSVITTFAGLNSTAYQGSTVTAIDCANVAWHVTNSSINGTVEGLFSNATASNATQTHVSPNGSKVSFTDLYPGATYEISLVYQTYQQCRHNITITPPGLKAHCEYLAFGYSIHIVWNKPAGVWSAVEINVTGTTYLTNGTDQQHYNIPGFQPAKNYEVSLASLSRSVRSSTTSFTCSTDPSAVIMGSVLAVLCFVLVCLAVFVWFRRPDLIRKKSFIGGSILSFKKSKAISIAKFEEHVFHLSMDEYRGFSLEYESLAPVGTEQTQKAAVLPENKPKNRFNNVLPYDWSRVRLTAHPSGGTDYINANYMPGYNRNREYIATQGPLPTTVSDFWRMIWEQRVTGIVMVTNCIEGGRTKCEQYWPPSRNPCLYGQLEVTMRSEQQEPNWTLREFILKHKNASESRIVKHFHFTAWPDHGVPQSTEVLIQFRGLVKQHIDSEGTGAPTVVHCSAGVGRTGTIIALDVLLQQLDKQGAVGINAFVHKMRLSRPHMVQTESQYIFLHQCIMDALHPCEKTEENIYENTEGLYVNATALREFRNNTNA